MISFENQIIKEVYAHFKHERVLKLVGRLMGSKFTEGEILKLWDYHQEEVLEEFIDRVSKERRIEIKDFLP